MSISTVTGNAKGREKTTQRQLRIQGEPVSAALMAGSLHCKETLQVSNTRFQTPVGPWSLTRDIAPDYRNKEQKISIGPHCWLNPNAERCAPQTIDAGAEGRAVVNLNRFDLAMLKPFMPETTQASGTSRVSGMSPGTPRKRGCAGQQHRHPSGVGGAGNANRQRCGAAGGVSDTESDGGIAYNRAELGLTIR